MLGSWENPDSIGCGFVSSPPKLNLRGGSRTEWRQAKGAGTGAMYGVTAGMNCDGGYVAERRSGHRLTRPAPAVWLAGGALFRQSRYPADASLGSP